MDFRVRRRFHPQAFGKCSDCPRRSDSASAKRSTSGLSGGIPESERRHNYNAKVEGLIEKAKIRAGEEQKMKMVMDAGCKQE